MHCSLYGLSIADPARIDRVMNNRANALDIKVMEEVAYKDDFSYFLASAYDANAIEKFSHIFGKCSNENAFPNYLPFSKYSGRDYFYLITYKDWCSLVDGMGDHYYEYLINHVNPILYANAGGGKTYYNLKNECTDNGDYDGVRKYEKLIEQGQNKYLSVIKSHLSNMGFPYEQTIEEYIRYNERNDTKLIINNMNFRFSDLKRIFYKVPISYQNLFERHTYIVGQSGSGKSELIKAICCKSVPYYARIIIDPHGDLANDFAYLEKCRIVDFSKSRFTINPFHLPDKSPQNRELAAQEITDLVGELMEDSSLSRLMQTVAFPIIYTLLKLPYADFSMLRDVIHPTDGIEKLKALENLVEPHHRAIWGDLIGDAYDTTKRSVFNRLQSLLNYSGIYNNLCGNDDFEDVLADPNAGDKYANHGRIIVFSLPITQIGNEVSQTLGRVLMTRLQIFAKRRANIPPREREPFFVFVDEFQNFLSNATAQTLDQFGRKYGLNLILAHQHTAQLTDREIKASVLANTKNKIVGMSNKDTRQALAGEMGLHADDFMDLKAGWFMTKFGSEPPRKIYIRMLKKSSSILCEYVHSKNKTMPSDVWGYTMNQSQYNPKGTQESASEKMRDKPKMKPKFDL